MPSAAGSGSSFGSDCFCCGGGGGSVVCAATGVDDAVELDAGAGMTAPGTSFFSTFGAVVAFPFTAGVGQAFGFHNPF